MRHRAFPPQPDDVKDYLCAVIVAGSRHFYDVHLFESEMRHYLRRIDVDGHDIVFISGAAATGADRLIINWCKRRGAACCEMPADWNKHHVPGRKNPAGMIRNRAMAEVAMTAPRQHLISFWDGYSPGTLGMIKLAKSMGITPWITVVETEAPHGK